MSAAIDMNKVLEKFNITSGIHSYGNGHINDTYVTDDYEYIIQRINTNVFKKPEEVMENIDRVTSYLRDIIKAEGGNVARETMTVVKTVDGKNLYMYDENNAFRVYTFVKDTITIESGSLEDLYNTGAGFGRFQKMLSKFPAETLHEAIKDFHNTPKRVEALKEAIAADRAGRAASVQPEIEFALKCAEFADVVTNGLADGSIPLRVTHNDTKINNILFDKDTRKAVCVIDLDTVMPGSALYDFGDALRMGGSTAAEDETDLSKVTFNADKFESFTKGYCSEMMSDLSEREIELLPFAAKLLTYECGIRFLTDYLNGDTYFKIHREHHNLDRARNQFKIVADIAAMEEELNSIVKNLR